MPGTNYLPSVGALPGINIGQFSADNFVAFSIAVYIIFIIFFFLINFSMCKFLSSQV